MSDKLKSALSNIQVGVPMLLPPAHVAPEKIATLLGAMRAIAQDEGRSLSVNVHHDGSLTLTKSASPHNSRRPRTEHGHQLRTLAQGETIVVQKSDAQRYRELAYKLRQRHNIELTTKSLPNGDVEITRS